MDRLVRRETPESGTIGGPARSMRAAVSSRAGVPVNSRPPVKPTTVEPFKHVIDEYKHQAQTITCTCGWHGSSAASDRGGSEWTAHLFEVRGKKR
jgi:hypothetical protein